MREADSFFPVPSLVRTGAPENIRVEGLFCFWRVKIELKAMDLPREQTRSGLHNVGIKVGRMFSYTLTSHPLQSLRCYFSFSSFSSISSIFGRRGGNSILMTVQTILR